jgi:phage terminase large subunit
MGAPELNWLDPDYDLVFRSRIEAIERLRAKPELVPAVLEFYKDNPVAFITDFGMTFDPRNAEIGKPTMVPFLLFPKQVEFINWLVERWRGRKDGLVEKSRDMGVSWLCVAFAVWMWRFHPGTVIGFGSRKEEYVDKLGDPKSLFWKVRQFIGLLPQELRPRGYDEKQHAPHMRILNPENGAAIVGEAGDNIGRGNRTSIYFKDESAHYEHAESVDAALSQTSNCKIDVSTPNGPGNPFYRKRHGGKIEIFIFDWHDDPRKDEAWYRNQCATLDPVVVAQEIDRNYEGSIANSFISGDLVRNAMSRGPMEVQATGGLMAGLDVARFGDDKTVLTLRRGRVLLKQVVWAKHDLVQTAARARNEIAAYNIRLEQIAVDTIGIGAGVADMMRAWWPDKTDHRTGRITKTVIDVNSAIRMDDGQNYNLRAKMATSVREWLIGASIPNDPDLMTDLTALQYGYRAGELLLESKDDAKRRGIKSPDRFDSLALTFAVPPAPVVEDRMPAVPAYQPHSPGSGM